MLVEMYLSLDLSVEHFERKLRSKKLGCNKYAAIYIQPSYTQYSLAIIIFLHDVLHKPWHISTYSTRCQKGSGVLSGVQLPVGHIGVKHPGTLPLKQ
jgi:hypothetical protein